MHDNFKAFITRYAALSPNEWERARAVLKPLVLKKGEALLHQTETCHHLYFVSSGLLRVYYMMDGEDMTNFFITENRFGTAFISFLTRQPAPENIEALEDCQLLQIHHDDLNQLYAEFPVWDKLGRIFYQEAMLIKSQRINSLICQTADARYEEFLKRFPGLSQRVAQKHIASYLGIHPKSLSRIRGQGFKGAIKGVKKKVTFAG
jgi:CRP/FNR family transcriptional regulator, anaerobic regulatory protein